jgi:16S rRNA (cytidine1402-2'-O)-methyltransferase
MHEEVKRLSLGEAAEWMAVTEPRGEYVIVVGPGVEVEVVIDDATLLSAVSAEMASGASLRDASASVAEMHAVPKRRVYELALAAQRK